MAQHLALPATVARHPFRQRLAQAQPRIRPVPKPRDDDQDLKLFALSFTAFFVCIYTFIF